MATIETRLQKIEAAAGAVSLQACLCVDRVRVVWPSGTPEPGPECCPICSGIRATVRVTYEGNDK